jgi:hypothetical protein
VLVRGQVVIDGDQLMVEPGFGRFVRRDLFVPPSTGGNANG